MKNTITKDIINHLEFLGFTIEAEENETSDILTCKNDARSNITAYISAGFVLLISRYSVELDKPTIELYKLIGEINSKTNCSKWYLSASSKDEVVVNIEGYTFDYCKTMFGRILETMERDIRAFLPKIEELKEGQKQ
jgi:hypothetical protein